MRPPDDVVRLRWVVDVLVGRFPLVAVVTVLVTAAVVLLVGARSVVYTATAEVAVRPITLQPFTVASSGVDRSVSMPTEVAVATGGEVATATAAALRVVDTAGFRAGLSVTTPDSSQVLTISYRSSSATTAATRAAAFARVYLAARSHTAASLADDQRAVLDARTKALVTRRAALVEQVQIAVAAAKNPVEADPLSAPIRSEITAIDGQLADIDAQRTDLAGLDTGGGTLLSTPDAHDAVSNRPGRSILLVGVLGGLLIGVVTALVVERRNPRLRARRELDVVTGAPVVAVPPPRRLLPRRGSTRRAASTSRLLHLVVARSRRSQESVAGAPLFVVPAGPRDAAGWVADGLRAAEHTTGPAEAAPGSTVHVVDPWHDDGALDGVVDRHGHVAGAAVVVARTGHTRLRDVEETTARLGHVGVPVAAVVLVDRSAR
ncbi:hypothetical protein ACXR2U_09415 [Jatrophihabitans sp. YIM 134969]